MVFCLYSPSISICKQSSTEDIKTFLKPPVNMGQDSYSDILQFYYYRGVKHGMLLGLLTSTVIYEITRRL